MAISKIVYKENASATPVTWMDATPATAVAADILSPKTAMLADGVLTTGTGTGGATNYVSGTFTGTTYGALEVNIPYTGSGYPLALIIYPSVGVYKSGSDIYDLVQRYVIVVYSRVKSNTGEAPTYTDTTETNRGSYLAIYKNSTSDPTTIANNGNLNSTMFTTSNAGDSLSTAVRFKSSTVLSVFIANASYGFAQNIEYTYQIVYSS